MLSLPIEILRQACKHFNYQFTLIDEFSGYLAEISDGNKAFYAGTGRLSPFPLNLATPHRLAGDKAHTRTLLQKKGYKVPMGDYFFLREEYREFRSVGKEFEDAFIFAKNLKYPLFVKPNGGSFGILCEVVHNEEELRNHLQKIAKVNYIALLEEVLYGDEYRIFVLDGEVQFLYRREKQKIIGDGNTSIRNLVKKFNESIISSRGKISFESSFLQEEIRKYGFNLDSILSVSEKLSISPRANISTGGKIVHYAEDVSEKTKKWIRKLAKTVDLRVFGVDLFVEDINDSDYFTILEINSNPGLNGIWEMGKQNKVFDIWGMVFQKFFVNK